VGFGGEIGTGGRAAAALGNTQPVKSGQPPHGLLRTQVPSKLRDPNRIAIAPKASKPPPRAQFRRN
jgi:hypothetical protein